MDREVRQMKTDNIYENADAIRGEITEDTGHLRTTRLQPPELTGSDYVRIRHYRAAAVCLVLLCVLLLTAAIVRCVTITQERKQLIQERDQLLIKITNFTEERDQVLTKITNITEEKGQLLTKIINLTEEKDQLLTNNTNLTKERDQLLTKIINLTEEKDQLLTKIANLTREKYQLLSKITNQTEERIQLIIELLSDGWIYYQSSLYFISSEEKNWAESRRYCTERGADLIIINNREEHEFVKKMSDGTGVWIGLTDSDVEGRWKWVDGANMTSGFWATGEPNGYKKENCAVLYSSGWYDYRCNDAFKCICVKNT
ncbi:CD209 antigen-like protein C isoform X2 [Ctenopharyngodon idella]|uniref:CD209 antigen-like protein C isoform X2 n=1 Tax=Ctenopharyngodon idella TaxID=7959 RepID=UPI002232668C|nr:CD209 antigen-like protein C isoform X2 [Ctenopharyngodon idella]